MEQLIPFVSIIVPCCNESKQIENLVHMISAQYKPGFFELIIADGGSEDGTREILDVLKKENSLLRVIDNPRRIVSTGLNSAIRVAQGHIILRMDAHTEYAFDYVQQCVTVLQESGADNVGGPWIAKARKGRVIESAIAAAFQSFFARGSLVRRIRYEGTVDTVYLGCWHREIFDRIGLFDEELVKNQDDEFNLRLTRAGMKIWQSPRIRSWYMPRENLCALFNQYMEYGYWKVRVLQKHKWIASIRHFIPSFFVSFLFVFPILSFWREEAGWIWLGLVSVYLLVSLTASCLIARREGWFLLPVLPWVFFIYHFGYGYGFLKGILNFLVLRRAP